MREIVQFYTVNGPIKFTSIPEFLRSIPKVVLPANSQSADQAVVSRNGSLPLVGGVAGIESDLSGAIEFEREVVELKHVGCTVDPNYDLKVTDLFDHMLNSDFMALNFYKKRLVHKIMTRPPHKRVRDLDLNAMEDASMDFALEFGNEAMAIDLVLNEFQKYFMVLNPCDFNIFLSKNGRTSAFTELTVVNPKRWIIYSYVNPEYRKMMHDRARFIP